MQEETIITHYEGLKHILELHGWDIAFGMLILVIGLLLLHWFIRRFKKFLR